MTNYRFKVFAYTPENNRFELSKYFRQVNIQEEVGSVPMAEIAFSNKGNVLNSLLISSQSFPIVISGSTDSGETYRRLFHGHVENVRFSIDPQGKRRATVQAYGGNNLRYSFASPNQLGFRKGDLGFLMTGSGFLTWSNYYLSSTATWQQDGNGNYPNGLLFNTGYSLSDESVEDYAPGLDDLYTPVGLGTNQILGLLETRLEPLGLTYIIHDDVYGTSKTPIFKILTAADYALWPYNGSVNFSVGDNISSFDRTLNISKKYDKVCLISRDNPSIFFIDGTGSKEGIKFVESEEIDTMRVMASKSLELYSEVPERFDLVTLPTFNRLNNTDPQSTLIGHSATISDKYETYTQNVIGVEQDITEDRWTTKVLFEKESASVPLTVEEIEDALAKIEEEELSGEMYLKAEGKTSSAYNESYIKLGEAGRLYPCIIGYGSYTSLGDVNGVPSDSCFGAPVGFKQINKKTVFRTGTGDTHPLSVNYAAFDSAFPRTLIREIVLIGNTLSNESESVLYTISSKINPFHTAGFVTRGSDSIYQTVTFNDMHWGGASSSKFPTKFPVYIDEIYPAEYISLSPSEELELYVHSYNLSVGRSYIDSLSTDRHDINYPWFDSFETFEAQDKLILSKIDHYPKTTSATISGGLSDRVQILIAWDIPAASPVIARECLHRIRPLVWARGTCTDGNSKAVYVSLWNTYTDDWELYGLVSSSDDGGYFYTDSKESSSATLSHSVIEGDGGAPILAMLIDCVGVTNETVSIIPKFVGLNLTLRPRPSGISSELFGSENVLGEVVPWSYETEFAFSFMPLSVKGIWLDYTANADGTHAPALDSPNLINRIPVECRAVVDGNLKTSYIQTNVVGYRGGINWWDTIVGGRSSEETDAGIRPLDAPVFNTQYNYNYVTNTVAISYFSPEEMKQLREQGKCLVSYSIEQDTFISKPTRLNPDLFHFEYSQVPPERWYWVGCSATVFVERGAALPIGTELGIITRCADERTSLFSTAVMSRCQLHPDLQTDSSINQGVYLGEGTRLNIQFNLKGGVFIEASDSKANIPDLNTILAQGGGGGGTHYYC